MCHDASGPQGEPGSGTEVDPLEVEHLIRSTAAVSAAIALMAVHALAGHRLLARLGWTMRLELSTLEQLGFGWAVGFSLSSAALLGLAALGALGPMTVAPALCLLAILAWPSARLAGRQLSSCVANLPGTPGQRALVAVSIVAALAWIWPLALQTLLPNSDWDSALYQLPLAERYLKGELWGTDPYFPAYAFPGAINLHYAALMALGLEAAIIPWNFTATLLTLALTYGLALRISGRSAAVWAALVLASVPLFWQVGVDPRIDGFLSLSITLALYALYLHMRQRAGQREVAGLYLTALALGVALGCKFTAVFYAGGIAAVALVGIVRGARDVDGLRVAGICALLLVVPSGIWYAANIAMHGDPLYPMIRGSYVVTDDGGRRRLDSEHDPLSAVLQAAPSMQRAVTELSEHEAPQAPTHLFNLTRILTEPDDYAVKPNHGVGPLPFVSLLLPLIGLLAWWKPDRDERRAVTMLWVTAWGSYALLGSQTNLLRYVLPVFPVLAATAGVAIARMRYRSMRVAVGLLAGVLLLSSYRAEVARLDVLHASSALTLPTVGLAGWDRVARIEWLAQVGYNFTPAMAHATKQINDFIRSGRMQPTDLVWMVGEGKGRLLDCRYVPDGSWFAHRFVAAFENAGQDGDALAKRLRKQGVTHVLYNRGYFDDWVLPETRTDRSRVAFVQLHLERFLADHGRTIFRGPGMQLVELSEPR